ncbi:MAG: hypothetical protein WDA75_16600 [Candidatus Latescibacterota bacterium]
MGTQIERLVCPTCGREVPELVRELEGEIAPKIVAAIQAKYPAWTVKDGTCPPCLNMFRHMVTRPSLFKRLKGSLQARLGGLHHPGE